CRADVVGRCAPGAPYARHRRDDAGWCAAPRGWLADAGWSRRTRPRRAGAAQSPAEAAPASGGPCAGSLPTVDLVAHADVEQQLLLAEARLQLIDERQVRRVFHDHQRVG